MTREFFNAYADVVHRHLGAALSLKSAIDLSHNPPEIDGPMLVRDLLATLDGAWWNSKKANVNGNWVWRDSVSKYTTQSKEVVLERKVVQLGGSDRWTYQMSTSSGLFGARGSKRRAIDLVNWEDGGPLRFIELKVGSNNPLHAIFEVLGYGLMYLLARKHGLKGNGRRDVMEATALSLEVLAPTGWYWHGTSRNETRTSLDMAWLRTSLCKGLAEMLATDSAYGLESLQINFLCFDAPVETAESRIVNALCRSV